MKIVRDRPVEVSAAGTVLLLTLLFGNGWFVTWLTATFGELAIPAALNIPAAIPGLRLWPLGQTTWVYTIGETLAAIGLTAFTAGWLAVTMSRRPAATPLRIAGSTSAAVVLGLAAADILRVIVASFAQDADLGTYLGYLAAALVFGTLWGVIAGIPVTVAAVTAARFRRTELVETRAPVTTEGQTVS